jgi:tripartite-type tricarboxylate transporter receptor subunit TctC
MFNIAAGINTVIVPYRGAAQVVTDLIAGRIDGYHANPLSVRGMLDSGELRPIAVTSPRRMALLPNVPTVAESGYPGFEAMNWTGLVGPAGMPAAIVTRLNGETRKALTNPEVMTRIAGEGGEPSPSTPEEFRTFLASEIEKWEKAVQGARVQVN